MRPFFITSTGTNIGKTLVTGILCWQLRQRGKNVTALKPVISGYKPDDMASDAALILKSCGITPTPLLMETISPWRFAAALSPDMAAAAEGKTLALDPVISFCREHAALSSDVLLVEGVGGVMVPLNHQYTVLDWMAALGWPVILVAGTYLGTLSHTLTAVQALQIRGLAVHTLILSESENSPVSMDATAATLKSFLPAGISIVKLPRIHSAAEPWKEAPPLSELCDR